MEETASEFDFLRKEGCAVKIVMARGDVKHIGFTVKLGQQVQTEFDDIYFTVKKDSRDREFKFQKKVSDGTITENNGHYSFTINPEDTDELSFGSYAFDIEIVRLPSIKKTFVGSLTLTDEVTHANNEGA